jgi:8-oxo-dGTP pyrophosphatase MutT (NUDIX family)
MRSIKTLRNYVQQILIEESERWGQSFTKNQSGKGSMSNIPIDQMNNTIPHLDLTPPRGACCFVQREDGKILAVSRKYDKTQMGLPGGKVEKGENFEDAAKRELFEETGIIATALRPIYEEIDDAEYHVITYVCDVEDDLIIKTSEEGRVAWVTWEQLLSGPFGVYNQGLKDILKQ